MKYLINQNDIVMINVTPGKPDPSQIYQPQNGDDQRQRVPLSAQKGNACWFYALKILHGGIGKFPSKGFEAQRNIEIAISTRRKHLSELYKQNDMEKLFVDAIVTQHQELQAKGYNIPLSTLYSKDAFRPFLDSDVATQTLDQSEEAVKYSQHTNLLLTQFINQQQFDDLPSFVKYRYIKKRNIINSVLLKELNIDIEKMYQADIIASGFKNMPDWKDLPEENKFSYLDNFGFRSAYNAFNFTESQWNPTQGFSALFQCLQTQGPLVVSGKLGKSYYVSPPFELSQKIAGRAIFGWQLNSKRENSEIAKFHTVVIIGAKRGLNGKGYVYFVDPQDGSDPSNLEQQRIYIISYENLVQNIVNLRAEMYLSESGNKRLHIPSHRYGVYKNGL